MHCCKLAEAVGLVVVETGLAADVPPLGVPAVEHRTVAYRHSSAVLPDLELEEAVGRTRCGQSLLCCAARCSGSHSAVAGGKLRLGCCHCGLPMMLLLAALELPLAK